MTEIIKGFVTDVLGDAEELLDVVKENLPEGNFFGKALDFGQERLLDCVQFINNL